jgi:hypothetical protein
VSTVGEWIAVDDLLPDEFVGVMVCVRDIRGQKVICLGYRLGGDEKRLDGEPDDGWRGVWLGPQADVELIGGSKWRWGRGDITHWMSLPEVPQ